MKMEMEQKPQTFLQFVQGRVNELLQSDIEWAEIVSILGAFIWGFVLLLPFNSFGTSKTYNLIAFLPESFWAVFFLCFFVVQFSAVLYNNLTWRIRAVGTGALIWAVVCSMAVGANPISTAYFYLIPTLGCVWAFARLWRFRV